MQKEQELLSSSFFKQFRHLRSLQGCKRVDRNLLRYYAKHRPSMYNMLREQQGFECNDYYSRGE